jgi:hypothetical protein
MWGVISEPPLLRAKLVRRSFAAVRHPATSKRPLGFASPPRDGFAFIAAPVRYACGKVLSKVVYRHRVLRKIAVPKEISKKLINHNIW